MIHLKLHSEYSIVDGIVRVSELMERLQQLNMSAVAVTDLSNLFAMVKFYRAAIKAGIKPIIGSEIIMLRGEQRSRVTLLCQNQQGYHNLTALISRGYTEGQTNDGVPLVHTEWMEEKTDGLIALSGGCQGDVGQALLSGKEGQAEQCLQQWLQWFPDRFYLELQRTGRGREQEYIHAAVTLAQQFNVPVVATNDVCFLHRDDFEAHEARVCINQGYVLDDKNRPRNYTEQQYLRSHEEMQWLFSDIPEALENTDLIAKRCNLKLELGRVCLPQFPTPNKETVEQYLASEAEHFLKKYLQGRNLTAEQSQHYHDRLERELGVINQMGFAGYFLIVADFIGWAKGQKIPVGPGRGSGAGSLVAFVLNITTLDPLEHELLFERFLNPERVSMPDFDIDFCMERRDEVIDYVAQRYGREAVSQIITYGTMAAKAVVRDVGRVLGYPYGFCDKIAKLIPFELGITLEKALMQEPQLYDRYKNEEEVTILIDLAKKLEGVARNAGKHAGGVVIAPGALTDFTPLYCEAGGQNLVTQLDKDDVEAVGLVKFDFLGLRTLTIIDWAIQNIADDIDIEAIPLDDEATFKLLKDCSTTAVFQLESRGMKDLIRRLQPDNFDEITALVALFRPGPLQSGMVDDFIDRKHGRAEIFYPHPNIEAILKPTYGVILYQEQVMQIAQELAGYSLGGADILRRAMGKKKAEEMAQQRKVFVEGAKAQDIDAGVAEHIFDLMEKFAGYGFNKSHSAAYALIAYQTAWLKAHYPAEFMAAVLSSDMDNTDKVVGFIKECERMGMTVLPPNVNQGHYHFTVSGENTIAYGLGAIKGVGEAAVEHIVAERKESGDYQDLFEFCRRVDLHKVSRRVLEPLVRSGAFDLFQRERSVLFASIDNAIKAADKAQRDAAIGQGDMFGSHESESAQHEQACYVDVQPWSMREALDGEKQTLGRYMTGDPMDQYRQELMNVVSVFIADLAQCTKKEVVIAGMVNSLRMIITKSGRRMAVLNIADNTGSTEVTLFSKVFEAHRELLQEDVVLVIRGSIEEDKFNGGVRILAESLQSLDGYRQQLAKRIVLQLKEQTQVDPLLERLPDVVTPYRGGRCPLNIRYDVSDQKAEFSLGEQWNINPQSELLEKLMDLCGAESVVVEY